MLITFFCALFRLHFEERLVLVVREVRLVEARVSNGEGLGAPLVLHTNLEAREEARGGQRGRPRAEDEEGIPG